MVIGYVPPVNQLGAYRPFPPCVVEHDPDEWQDVPHNTFEHALLTTPGVEMVNERNGIWLVTINLASDPSWLRLGAGVQQIADHCWRAASHHVETVQTARRRRSHDGTVA